MKKLSILIIAVCLLISMTMGVSADNGQSLQTTNEHDQNCTSIHVEERVVNGGDINNLKVGDIIEDAHGNITMVFRVDADGTAYATSREHAMSRACTHPAASLTATGLWSTEYNHINTSTQCVRTRTKYTNKCTCGATVFTYGVWSSYKAHNYGIFLGRCNNVINSNGDECDRSK